MKQVKFLMVALTILMGTMVTSCMNGEEDPNVSGQFIMEVVNTFPYTFRFSGDDVKYVATNSESLLTSDLTEGNIVLINWTYNKDEQKVDANTEKVKVLVQSTQNLSSKAMCTTTSDNGASYENSTVNFIGIENSSHNAVVYFDENRVIIPIACLLKEQSMESLLKHSFALVYDESKTIAGASEIVFYLRHLSSEEKPTNTIYFYKAFNIKQALEQFEKVAKQKPTTLTVMVNETDKRDSNVLTDAKKDLIKYSVDYKVEK